MKLPAKVFIALGTVMALGLLWVADQPGMGEIVLGKWHYMAHFASFVLLGAMWALGLPRIPVLATGVGIIAFGFLHEALEMAGHAHGFEFYDVIVDGVGAIAGTLSVRVMRDAFCAT